MTGCGSNRTASSTSTSVSAIRYEYDRNKPITYSVSVGDDSKEHDPFAQGIKALQAVYTIAAMAAGEGWLFD